MDFPSSFEKAKAIELGNMVIQAYNQLQYYKKEKEWKLLGDYSLASKIIYNRWQMGFDVNEDASPTIIDEEQEEVKEEVDAQRDVSFGIVDDVVDFFKFKDYPMGFVATSKDKKSAYLIFRGTVSKQEFVKDAKILLEPYPHGSDKNFGNVAVGFLEVYNACRESFLKVLSGLDKNMELYISGHSLGAALSVLSLPDVIKRTPFKSPILYNFGCPRVGDTAFVQQYNLQAAKKTLRIVNAFDLVPTLPPPAPIPFLHVDVPYEFDLELGSVANNHAMKSYVTALGGQPFEDKNLPV